MVLNIIALLLVLAITFLHSLFGLFSGLLNVFCSISALAIAFGCTEAVNRLVTGAVPVPSAYTEACVFVLLFVVSLLILRVLADTFIRGNVRVPMYLDWGGGAVCGFINAQICVGVLILGFLMLPWGGRVLGFSRMERDPDNEVDSETGRAVFRTNHIWLRSDRFAVGLFNLLSNGSLRGNTSFASVYPDFPSWVFWTGNQIQPEVPPSVPRDDKVDGFDTKGLQVETWWTQTAPLANDYTRYRKGYPTKGNDKPPYEPYQLRPQPGRTLLGVRLKLLDGSADRDKNSIVHRFRPSNIRLVGDIIQYDGRPRPTDYLPQVIGGADANLGDLLRVVDIDNNFSIVARADTKIDVYFEVDENFKPRFVEYRRHARAPLTGKPAAAPPPQRLAAGEGEKEAGGPRGRGPARFIDVVVRSASGANDRLPVAVLRERVAAEAELSGDLFVSGSFSGDVGTLSQGMGARVERFVVPEGKRIFQLQTMPRRAQSLFGQIFNFVGARTNQYFAVDREGTEYGLAGYYAIVKREGKEFLELFFTPDPEGTGFRGMVDLKEIRFNELDREDSVLGLIFLVPPGKCIVAVRSQGGRVDLGAEMCVEP